MMTASPAVREPLIYEWLKRLKNRTGEHHFAIDQIAEWTFAHLSRTPEATGRVLDLGLGRAAALLAIRERCHGLPLELYGLEAQPRWVEHANSVGILTYPIDLERDPLPFGDATLDVVLANHVIEHVKELFWIFSEISRVLKPGGLSIIGCPNLASWHNRVALLIGRQPPSMQLLGAHVRGVTLPGFRTMIEYGGFFEMVDHRGTNFYPLTPGPSRVMARMLPTLTASHHFLLRRTAKPGRYIEVLEMNVPGVTDTPYYRGPDAAPG